MPLDLHHAVTPGLDPGVHLQRAMDGRALGEKTRFALSPGHDD